MKKIILSAILAGFMFTLGCGEKNPIGSPIDIIHDYEGVGGEASASAEERIAELFADYGSRFIYDFTQADFVWTYGAAGRNTDSIAAGDPRYVDGLLGFLDDIWLKHMPEEFKKGLGIPYRVLLADSIWAEGGTAIEAKVTGRSIAFSGANADFAALTPEQKREKMDKFNSVIWTNYYLTYGLMEFPQEFFSVSDYDVAEFKDMFFTPLYPPENLGKIRNEGFIMDWVPQSYGRPDFYSEWFTASKYTADGRGYDAQSYLNHMLRATDAQMEQFLIYPKVAEKWQILIDFYLERYGIDVRAIANMTFE